MIHLEIGSGSTPSGRFVVRKASSQFETTDMGAPSVAIDRAPIRIPCPLLSG
jgi:hypothetical protein